MRRAIARLLRGLACMLAPLKIAESDLALVVNTVFTGKHGVILADPDVQIDPALLERCELYILEV